MRPYDRVFRGSFTQQLTISLKVSCYAKGSNSMSHRTGINFRNGFSDTCRQTVHSYRGLIPEVENFKNGISAAV